MRIAANLTLLFPDTPPLLRAELARKAGFDGAEVLFPYDHPPADWQAALNGLPLALINTPAGDWAAGERGFAAVPGQQARFRRDFTLAVSYARSLGAGRLHVMAGNASGPQAERLFAANLAWAAGLAPDLSLTIEPLNPVDMPGYFLNDFQQAAQMIMGLGLPNLGLQFDLWHATRLHHQAHALWDQLAPIVTHVQIAGLTARAEPCTEALQFARHITAAGYAGWIAAEYRPSTAMPMGWLADLRDHKI